MADTLKGFLAEIVGLAPSVLVRRGRSSATISRRRQLAMYLVVKELGWGTIQVGGLLERDNTTVRHAVKVVERLRDTDPELRAFIQKVGHMLRASFPAENLRNAGDPVESIRSISDPHQLQRRSSSARL